MCVCVREEKTERDTQEESQRDQESKRACAPVSLRASKAEKRTERVRKKREHEKAKETGKKGRSLKAKREGGENGERDREKQKDIDDMILMTLCASIHTHTSTYTHLNIFRFQDVAKSGFELPTLDAAKHAVSLTLPETDLAYMDISRTISLNPPDHRPSYFHSELSCKI